MNDNFFLIKKAGTLLNSINSLFLIDFKLGLLLTSSCLAFSKTMTTSYTCSCTCNVVYISLVYIKHCSNLSVLLPKFNRNYFVFHPFFIKIHIYVLCKFHCLCIDLLNYVCLNNLLLDLNFYIISVVRCLGGIKTFSFGCN